MPHGLPDWGLVGPRISTYGLDDLGEAVARLGSPVVLDRRGDVILMDDFSRGLNAARYSPVGIESSYGLVTYPVRSGPYSVRLTTGSDFGDSVLAEWSIAPSIANTFGFELWFTMATHVELYTVLLCHYDGALSHFGAIRLEVDPFQAYYIDSAGVYQPFDISPDPILWIHSFHVLKLAIDITADRYVRVIFDGNTYDLSDYAIRVLPDVRSPYVYATFRAGGDSEEVADTYLDRIIITQSEPW